VAVFDGVSFAYGAAPVLSDVSFKVGAHEFVSIVGPNGGGKTTLLRLLLGLEDPQRGRVEVLGTTPRRARMDIGYMPQHLRFDPLFPITSIEVVLMGRIRRGRFWYSRDDRAAALAALERVGMAATLPGISDEPDKQPTGLISQVHKVRGKVKRQRAIWGALLFFGLGGLMWAFQYYGMFDKQLYSLYVYARYALLGVALLLVLMAAFEDSYLQGILCLFPHGAALDSRHLRRSRVDGGHRMVLLQGPVHDHGGAEANQPIY
jgi:energy-coupling factor transporter ATP-binding protein EcfA2